MYGPRFALRLAGVTGGRVVVAAPYFPFNFTIGWTNWGSMSQGK